MSKCELSNVELTDWLLQEPLKHTFLLTQFVQHNEILLLNGVSCFQCVENILGEVSIHQRHQ